MFHVEHRFSVFSTFGGSSDASLAQYHQLAMERIDERISRHPREGRWAASPQVRSYWRRGTARFFRLAQEGLSVLSVRRFDAHRADRDQVERFMEFGRGSNSSKREVSTSASRRPRREPLRAGTRLFAF